MSTPKISPTLMVLLCLVTVLLSSISTTIFSESSFNDHASISVTVLAVIGITLTAAKFIFDTIHNICNP